jgi:transcriptional regulator with XRE-family HTH domain
LAKEGKKLTKQLSDINHLIGLRAKDARQKNGLTREQVASYLGVTEEEVLNLEDGLTTPNLAYIIELADIYGCSIHHILCGNDEPMILVEGSEILTGDDLKEVARLKRLMRNMVSLYVTYERE